MPASNNLTSGLSLGGGFDASAGGSSAGLSAHLTLTAAVGAVLLAIVIFLPKVM